MLDKLSLAAHARARPLCQGSSLESPVTPSFSTKNLGETQCLNWGTSCERRTCFLGDQAEKRCTSVWTRQGIIHFWKSGGLPTACFVNWDKPALFFNVFSNFPHMCHNTYAWYPIYLSPPTHVSHMSWEKIFSVVLFTHFLAYVQFWLNLTRSASHTK